MKACNFDGCSYPKHHYNPMMTGIKKFQKIIARTFSKLPNEGKIAECAKRVALAIASPFIFLALGISYLLGFALDSFWKKKHIKELNMLKPNPHSPEFANLSDNQLKDIWFRRRRLFSLAQEMDDDLVSDWKTRRINKILDEPQILDQLNVELHLDKVEEIFRRYGIIVLRQPKEDNLYFFCGNNPIYSSAMDSHYTIDDHQHRGADTVDCDLLMNPTIVASASDEGLKNYFESISHKYLKISGCGMAIISQYPDKTLSLLKVMCKENSIVENAFSDLAENEDTINNIEKIASSYCFETTSKKERIKTVTPTESFEHDYVIMSFKRVKKISKSYVKKTALSKMRSVVLPLVKKLLLKVKGLSDPILRRSSS